MEKKKMSTKKDILMKAVKRNPAPASSFGTDPLDPWSKKSNIPEEVESLDEVSRQAILDKYLYAKGINPKFVTKDVRISHAKSGQFLKYRKDHQNDYEPPKPFQTKEEVEPLDELSYDTLKSYSRKRADQTPALHQKASDTHQHSAEHPEKHKVAKDALDKNLNGRKVALLKMVKKKALGEEVLDEAFNFVPSSEMHGAKANGHAYFANQAKKAGKTDLEKEHLTAKEAHLKAEKSRKVKDSRDANRMTRELKKKDNGVHESVEPLDEATGIEGLKRKFVPGYGKKVAKDRAQTLHNYGRDPGENRFSNDSGKSMLRASKKYWKIAAGANKKVSESAESLDELSKTTLKSYEKKATDSFNKHSAAFDKALDLRDKKTAAKHDRPVIKRMGGLMRLGSRLKKEEVLDELSRGTLSKYIRAADTHSNILQNRGTDKLRDGDEDGFKDFDKAAKRDKGIKRAKQKGRWNEDTYNDPKAATQDNGGLAGADLIEKRKAGVKILKDIKKKIHEDLTDTDKENKSVQTYGKKKPEMKGKEFETKMRADDETAARAVLKGGTTMTGQARDTVIIDPSLRKPIKGMNQQPDFPQKDGKISPR